MNNHKFFDVVTDADRELWEEEERLYWENERRDLEHDPYLTDAEADANALASCGWGTDEDYGSYDDGGDW